MEDQQSEFPQPIKWIFLALVVSLGFGEPHLRIYGFPLQFTEIIFVILAVSIAGLFAIRRKFVPFDPVYFIFGAYFFALALSAIFSERPNQSVVKLAGEAYLIGLGLLAFLLARSPADIRRVFVVWLAGSTIVALIAVVTVAMFYIDRSSPWHLYFLHHYGSLPPGNYPRVDATFIYPAMLCNFLNVGIVFLLGSRRLEWISPPIFWILLILHLIAAAFTVTPGLGGIFLAVGIWIAWEAAERRQMPRAILYGGLGTAAAIAFVIVSAFSVRTIATSPYTFDILGWRIDPTQRLLTWQGSFETFLQNPVFGKGLDLGVASVRFLAPSGQNQLLTEGHNVFLNVAGQSGILGVGTLVALSVFLFSRVRPLTGTNDELFVIRRTLFVAFIAAFIYQGLTGSFENARHLWVLFGMMAAMPYCGRERSSE